jgi:hypothetical protein
MNHTKYQCIFIYFIKHSFYFTAEPECSSDNDCDPEDICENQKCISACTHYKCEEHSKCIVKAHQPMCIECK